MVEIAPCETVHLDVAEAGAIEGQVLGANGFSGGFRLGDEASAFEVEGARYACFVMDSDDCPGGRGHEALGLTVRALWLRAGRRIPRR